MLKQGIVLWRSDIQYYSKIGCSTSLGIGCLLLHLPFKFTSCYASNLNTVTLIECWISHFHFIYILHSHLISLSLNGIVNPSQGWTTCVWPVDLDSGIKPIHTVLCPSLVHGFNQWGHASYSLSQAPTLHAAPIKPLWGRERTANETPHLFCFDL